MFSIKWKSDNFCHLFEIFSSYFWKVFFENSSFFIFLKKVWQKLSLFHSKISSSKTIHLVSPEYKQDRRNQFWTKKKKRCLKRSVNLKKILLRQTYWLIDPTSLRTVEDVISLTKNVIKWNEKYFLCLCFVEKNKRMKVIFIKNQIN